MNVDFDDDDDDHHMRLPAMVIHGRFFVARLRRRMYAKPKDNVI